MWYGLSSNLCKSFYNYDEMDSWLLRNISFRFATIEFNFLIDRDALSVVTSIWTRDVTITLSKKHEKCASIILAKLISFTNIMLFLHFSSSSLINYSLHIKERVFVIIIKHDHVFCFPLKYSSTLRQFDDIWIS